jgi:tRNA G10  N-methylase Trm11
MKCINAIKAAKKLEFEAKRLQAIVDDYHYGKNPLKLERNTMEEIANAVLLVNYVSQVIEGAVLAVNNQIPQDDFVGYMRGVKVLASIGQQVKS